MNKCNRRPAACGASPAETIEIELPRKQSSKLDNIGFLIGIGVFGFWFGIGATLGTKMVNSLEELISRK